MTQATKHWTILGAGAVGHLLACSFMDRKIPSTLVYRKKHPNDKKSIVNYSVNGKTKQYSLNYLPVDQLETIECLLVTVKSYHVENAILSISNKLTPRSHVFLLQNGMGTLEKVTKLLTGKINPAQIYPGTNTHGVYLKKGNNLDVNHAGVGQIIIGSNYLNNAQIDPPGCFYGLTDLPLNINWSSSIEKRLWLKLAVNAVINPLTAINNCLNGELIQSNTIKTQILLLCTETAKLYKKLNLGIPENEIISEVFEVINKTTKNQSSMLKDIESKKTTEIESITGYLLKKAKSEGVDMNCHNKIYQQLKN